MKKSLLTLACALACVASALSLTGHAHAQSLKFLTQFNGANGAAAGSLIQGPDGNFYGAAAGGSYAPSEIFRMTPAGEITPIYGFCLTDCADGGDPAAPVLGSDGNLYGVTAYGGNATTQAGTFYRMTLDGAITTLHQFCPAWPCMDGAAPTGIVQASDGNFYGTTVAGGAHEQGTLFRISPTGELKVVHAFCSSASCADGGGPTFPPIQGTDGNFYGATYSGGSEGGGVVYQMTPSGTFTVLHDFCGQNDHGCETGSDPNTVVQDANGNLFGTTVYALSCIFEITPANQFIVLRNFEEPEGGDSSGLTLASDGNIYGVTNGPGDTQVTGTIFSMTPGGDYKTLHVFLSGKAGYDVSSPLLQATDGSFYGTTSYGPGANLYGTVYRLSNGLGPFVTTVPVAGKAGKHILILGNGLTGTTSVTFDGVPASFTVRSDTYIQATVPAGAATGIVSVVTPSGTLNSNPQFVVTK